MIHDTIGDLASTLLAFGVRCNIELDGGIWVVRVGPATACDADLEAALDEAIRALALAASKAVA